jgi:hypothetical protein
MCTAALVGAWLEFFYHYTPLNFTTPSYCRASIIVNHLIFQLSGTLQYCQSSYVGEIHFATKKIALFIKKSVV